LTRGAIELESGESQGHCAHSRQAESFQGHGALTAGDRGWFHAAQVVAEQRRALFRGRGPPPRIRRL